MQDLLSKLPHGISSQKEFVAAMMKEHRTGQQAFTRLCVAWLEALSEVETFDQRNEASVFLARGFVRSIPAQARALPMIYFPRLAS